MPLGLMVGRTFLLRNSNGLDTFVGAYSVFERPDNAPEWQIR